jgi:hypothetical protein
VKRAVVMKVNYHHHIMSLQPIGILSGTDFDTCMHTCPAENPSAGPPPKPRRLRKVPACAAKYWGAPTCLTLSHVHGVLHAIIPLQRSCSVFLENIIIFLRLLMRFQSLSERAHWI